MRRLVVAAFVLGAGLTGLSLPAYAHGPDVGPHRHFIVTPNGDRVQVGPGVCENPSAQDGFNHFHGNVHVGTPALEAFQQGSNPVAFAATGC